MSESSVRLDTSGKGIAHVIFDVPNSKVNVLSESLMMDLLKTLEQIAANKSLKGVIFQSGKTDNFIAGADINAIRSLQRKSPIEAYEASRLGKIIFEKIEKSSIPTVAAIQGTSFGGGTELALSCKYRLAADTKATAIGLPETQLGFVPGWGGTVRLPKIIGLQAALQLIMDGKPVNARKAWRLNLIDEYVEPDKLLSRAEEIALGARINRYQKPLFWGGVKDFFLERTPMGRAIVGKVAFKNLMRVTKGKYPAPVEALKLVLKNAEREHDVAFEAESQAFAKLAVSEISQNLVGIFLAQTESKKMPVKIEDDQAIKVVGVLGAGVMGSGIAQAAAYAGYQVVLKDVDQKFLDKGFGNITKLFDDLVNKHKLTQQERDRALTSIRLTLDYADLKDCDLVIEAVLEDMQIKQEALAEIEKAIAKPFIFATNTSSLSVSELSKAAKNPEHAVGLHFFNPVHKMPLVEVVRVHDTSDDAIAKTKAFAIKLGKTVVTTGDAPGFVVNRVLAPYLREAVILLEQGVSPLAIDKAMTNWGMPMGPFTLMDEIGLDISAKVTHVLSAALGERMGPPGMLSKLETLNLLGKKGNKGFYLYDENGKRSDFNPDVLAAVNAPESIKMPSEIQDRLMLIMLNEAARCLEEQIIDEPSQLDLALIFGIGFPPFRGGILRYADHIGLKIVHQKLAFLSKVAGENYLPCNLILEKVASNTTFYHV